MLSSDSIRKEILFQLYAFRPSALTPHAISKAATKESFRITTEDVKREADFLVDEGLIFPIKDLAGTAQMWRIHANGVRYYEQNFQ